MNAASCLLINAWLCDSSACENFKKKSCHDVHYSHPTASENHWMLRQESANGKRDVDVDALREADLESTYAAFKCAFKRCREN